MLFASLNIVFPANLALSTGSFLIEKTLLTN